MAESLSNKSARYVPFSPSLRFQFCWWQFFIATSFYVALLDKTPKSVLSKFWSRKLCHSGAGILMMFLDTKKWKNVACIWIIALGSLLLVWVPLSQDTDVSQHHSWRTNIKPLTFGKLYDPGITWYLIIVMVWSLLHQPMSGLAPVFFGDPLAAIVGTYLSPRIPLYPGADKTVLGSAAVFLSTYFLFYFYNEFYIYCSPETDDEGTAAKGNNSIGFKAGGSQQSQMINCADESKCYMMTVSVWYKVVISALCCLMEAFGGSMDNIMLSVPAILGWIGYHVLHWGGTIQVTRAFKLK